MNNLAGHLVHYYDVGNFHATIFKYTRALHVSATTCIVQLTTIHNGIGYTLIGQQGSLASTKNIATVSGTNGICVNHIRLNNYLAQSFLATLVTYSSSRANQHIV